MKFITRTIWILSFISLFTDMASEMLYPIMPLYLKSIGFTMLTIGFLEGLAEFIAGWAKSYFGKWSDLSHRRAPFVQVGYALSALAKPGVAFLPNVFFVFGARTLDRLGKGIRTGARDAILSDESDSKNKASVFGFHRMMDTFGAVLGPLCALLFLYYHPNQYRALFLFAFLPGIVAILFSINLKDTKANIPISTHSKPGFFESLLYWKRGSEAYRKLIFGLLIFALVNSSDVFLLLKIKESGATDSQLIFLYIFYNLIYALFAFPLGILADRLGIKKIFLIGITLFAFVYLGFGISTNIIFFIALLFIYGIYAAATEGVAKAWISQVTAASEKATGLAYYGAAQSLGFLFASTAAGLIWQQYGSTLCFFISAGVSFMVMIYIWVFVPSPNQNATL